MRVAAALVVPTLRAVKWLPMILSLAIGLALLMLSVVLPDNVDPSQLLTWVRTSAVFGALSVAFLLDDPAATTTAAAPVPVSVRRAVRIGLALPVLACWWGAVLAACATFAPQAPVPTAALLLEGATMTVATLTLSVICARWVPEGLGGVAAAPGLLLGAALAAALPEPVALFTTPNSPHWASSHYGWVGILAACCAAVVLSSRSPAGRRITARPRTGDA
jgi:hypothetical protein